MLLAPTVMPVRTVESRSQLAGFPKNTILMNLGGAFGTGRFICGDASRALRLNHGYLSRVLSRLRKASLLRVVEERSRAAGGVGYLYEIAPKGWKKIRYLQGMPENTIQGNRDQFEPGITSQIIANSYVLTGEGKAGDFSGSVFLKSIPLGPRVPSVMDDIGALLCQLDPKFLIFEVWRQLVLRAPIDPELKSWLVTTTRAGCLQRLGYIPKNLPLSTFVPNALYRGGSETTVLLGLTLRQIRNQREEIEALRHEKAELTRSKDIVESDVIDLRRDNFDARLKCNADTQLVCDNSEFLLNVAETLDIFDSHEMVTILQGRGKLDPRLVRASAGSTVPSVLEARIELLLTHLAEQDIIIDFLLRHIGNKSKACRKLKLIVFEKVLYNIKEHGRIDRIYT